MTVNVHRLWTTDVGVERLSLPSALDHVGLMEIQASNPAGLVLEDGHSYSVHRSFGGTDVRPLWAAGTG